jgi:hypothetical protein
MGGGLDGIDVRGGCSMTTDGKLMPLRESPVNHDRDTGAASLAVPGDLRSMTLEDLRAHMTAAVLDALRLVPDCVAVRLRREVAGRTWDITLTSDEYTAIGHRPGQRAPVILYGWQAEEPVSPLPDEVPDALACLKVFDTPEEALADALAILERGKDGAVAFLRQRDGAVA